MGSALLASLACVAIKPHFLLAVPVAFAVAALASHAAAWSWHRRVAAMLGHDLAGHSAAFDRFVEALARGDEPKRRKLQNFTRLFYRPLERGANLIYAPVVGLALVVAVVLSARWGWRAAPVLTLAAMQLGLQRTIAMSHSHAVIRYRAAQYPLTILLLAVAALTLVAAAAALRRRHDKPGSSP